MAIVSRASRTLFLIMVLAFPSVAAAEPIRITFTTTLTYVSDLAPGLLGVTLQSGQMLTGSASFDLTGPDTSSLSNAAIYPASGSLRLPFTAIPIVSLQVIDNIPIGDFAGVLAMDARRLPAPYNGLWSVLGFQDPSGALLTSDNAVDAAALSQFPGGPYQVFLLSALAGEDRHRVDLLIGTIQASPAAPVPEPGTLLLVAAGAAALGRRAWAQRPPSAARG